MSVSPEVQNLFKTFLGFMNNPKESDVNKLSEVFAPGATFYGGQNVHEKAKSHAGDSAVQQKLKAVAATPQQIKDIYSSSSNPNNYVVVTVAGTEERAAEFELTETGDGLKVQNYVPFYAAHTPQ